MKKARITYPDNLLSDLTDKTIYLDTNTFITALNYPNEFGDLLSQLEKNNCKFGTIFPVVVEFTRGSENIDAYNKRLDFVKEMTGGYIYPIERNFSEMTEFIVVMQRIKSAMSYTDLLLLSCLKKFPQIYLLTQNHKDVPLEIFDRKYIITLDTMDHIWNHGIYQLSGDRYRKAEDNIAKG